MSHCARCGELVETGAHQECEARLRLEPPRYCPRCGRRMVVQLTPTAWSALCSRHGITRSDAVPEVSGMHIQARPADLD